MGAGLDLSDDGLLRCGMLDFQASGHRASWGCGGGPKERV